MFLFSAHFGAFSAIFYLMDPVSHNITVDQYRYVDVTLSFNLIFYKRIKMPDDRNPETTIF